ncbi:MAG: hypothetical protein MJ133_07640 [Lachnospiraceae bacterium]|nr:hypothetical protein [Lachnospiraceae bacterium]
MSLYVADVGIVKIKPEYVEQFGYLFNGEYEKVQDSVFDVLLSEKYSDEFYEYGIKEISNWKHDDEKEEWIGKYNTSYENGIFTYGLSYNHNNARKQWFVFDFFEVLDNITEEVIFKDGWCEPM